MKAFKHPSRGHFEGLFSRTGIQIPVLGDSLSNGLLGRGLRTNRPCFERGPSPSETPCRTMAQNRASLKIRNLNPLITKASIPGFLTNSSNRYPDTCSGSSSLKRPARRPFFGKEAPFRGGAKTKAKRFRHEAQNHAQVLQRDQGQLEEHSSPVL